MSLESFDRMMEWLGGRREERRTDWGDLMSVAWELWGFCVAYDEHNDRYWFWSFGDTKANFLNVRRELRGVADGVRRRWVSLPGSWNFAASPDIVNGKCKDIRILFWRTGKSVFTSLRILCVSKVEHPDAYPIALSVLYDRQVAPLIDYLLESRSHAQDHEWIEAAWAASQKEIAAASHGDSQ